MKITMEMEVENIPENYTGIVEYTNGDKSWSKNGQLHREDGPAIEYANGDKSWYKNGQLHREDGPALEFANGSKSWFKNNLLHREDGPAREYSNGYKSWYIDGVKLTEKDFLSRTLKTVSCNGKEVVIDGKKYKLQLID
jgi:hypothetical protein